MERKIIPPISRIHKNIRILVCHCCFLNVFIIILDNLDENGYEKNQEEEKDPDYSPTAQLFFVIHNLIFLYLSLLETNNSIPYFLKTNFFLHL